MIGEAIEGNKASDREVGRGWAERDPINAAAWDYGCCVMALISSGENRASRSGLF
jgi:hypothetical protein